MTSPYRTIRARYDEVSSVELIPAVRDRDPIPPRYRLGAGLRRGADIGARP